MKEIELIVALSTFVCATLTIIKVKNKHIKWYWNFAPWGLGFVSCLWLAKIV